MAWEPVDFTTPAAWHVFFGKQIGGTTIGLALFASWRCWIVGGEWLGNGAALYIGPLGIGVGFLRPNQGTDND